MLPGHPWSRPLHMVFPSSRHSLLHSHCRSPSLSLLSTSPPFFPFHPSLTHPLLSRSRRTGEPNKPSLARYGAEFSIRFLRFSLLRCKCKMLGFDFCFWVFGHCSLFAWIWKFSAQTSGLVDCGGSVVIF